MARFFIDRPVFAWVLAWGLLFSYFQGEFSDIKGQELQDLRFCFIYHGFMCIMLNI